jgi:colicin import membrane protein
MIGMSPKSASQDETGVFGLLAFLADPAKCEARAKELRELSAQVGQSVAEASEKVRKAESLQQEALGHRQAAEQALAKAAQAKRDADAVRAKAEADQKRAADRERELVASEGALRKLKADIDTQHGNTAERLSQREKAVIEREQKAEEALQRASTREAEYTAKLNQFRSIVG